MKGLGDNRSTPLRHAHARMEACPICGSATLTTGRVETRHSARRDGRQERQAPSSPVRSHLPEFHRPLRFTSAYG
jgi:hypothetical protein